MSQPKLSASTRRALLIGGILLIGFGLLWIYFVVTDKPKTEPKSSVQSTVANPNSKSILAPGSQVDPKDGWFATAGKQVSEVGDRVAKVEDEQKRIQDAQKRIEGELLPRIKEILDSKSGKIDESHATAVETSPPPKASLPRPTFPSDAALPRGNPPIRQPGALGAPPEFPAADHFRPAGESRTMIRLSSLRDEANTPMPAPGASTPMVSPAAIQAGNMSAAPRKRTIDNFLPISFTPAVLLGGLDAPTGGQSQSNPHPVLMRLESNAILPNRYRAGIKECLVIGAGYGDISSERCYVRTERLSCVKDDGSVLETKLTGSIFGEDGKVGMRGRMVEKQGQILANALMSGVVGGIGQGLQSRASTVSTSPLGSTTSVTNGREFEAGIGSGIGRAMDRLAQYYISVAEKVFPVVECDAGRKVDVVVTAGIALEDELSSPSPTPGKRATGGSTSPGVNDE